MLETTAMSAVCLTRTRRELSAVAALSCWQRRWLRLQLGEERLGAAGRYSTMLLWWL